MLQQNSVLLRLQEASSTEHVNRRKIKSLIINLINNLLKHPTTIKQLSASFLMYILVATCFGSLNHQEIQLKSTEGFYPNRYTTIICVCDNRY